MAGMGHLDGKWCETFVTTLDHEIFVVGPRGRILYANPQAEKVFGGSEDQVRLGEIFGADQNLGERLRRIAQNSDWSPINLVAVEGPMAGVEFKMRGRGTDDADGNGRVILLVADRQRDAGFTQLRQLVRKLNADLATRARRAENLEGKLDAETRLHRELIHRVKNNLALLTALISIRRRVTDNAEVHEALDDLEMRIHSIRAVHDILDRAGEIDEVQVGALIRALCAQIESSILPDHVTVENDLLDVRLGVEHATPLSLMVNELITNAIKHAFPEGKSGRVTVALKKNGHDKLEVRVDDNGKGNSADFTREGTGSKIVTALAAQIGGELTRQSDESGTRFSFVFPYDNQTRPGA